MFVEELLGAVRDGRMDHDYLPPSLRDVLLARAELLSPSAQHVLRVVSAGGRWVPDGLLASVAELPGPELNAGLREAVEQQLLVVDASGRGYGFRHELARAAIHEDLLPGERAQLHKAYAEAIEATPELAGSELDAVSMLAYHWLAAHDLPRALPASVRAGRAAAEAWAPSAAQRHFELALELWSQVPDAEQRADVDHSELLEAAAHSASRSGALDRALALVDEALGEVGHDGEPEHRATLLVRRAELLVDLGRDEEGLAVLEEAVGLLPQDSPSRGQRPGTRHATRARWCAWTRYSARTNWRSAPWRRRRPSARRKRSSRLSSCLLSRWSTTVMWRVDSRCFEKSSGRPRVAAIGGSRRGRISASPIFS